MIVNFDPVTELGLDWPLIVRIAATEVSFGVSPEYETDVYADPDTREDSIKPVEVLNCVVTPRSLQSET